MTDRQKVIKGLTECVAAGLETACPANCPYFLQCFPDAGLATPFMSLMADALSLLKEQEAVEPEVETLNEIDRIYRCPKCHKHFFYEKQKYCDQCGQAVKWDE